MPRHLTESEDHIPFSSASGNYTNGIVGIPSGQDVPDVEARLISDALTTLDSRIIYIVPSGTLVLASGASQWTKLQFELL